MSKKILVVDDEEQIVQLFEKKLRLKGYDAISALTGEDGLAKAINELPDLIVLDIRLPGMDGTKVLELLKENDLTKNIPVLFVTAVDSPRTIVRNYELGAEDYLLKPISPKTLIGHIDDILVSR